MGNITNETSPAGQPHFASGKVILLLHIAAVYLAFMGLDNTYFWDDEAQVAIIAKNFQSSGRLIGWDGRNLFGYRNGALLNDDLCIINPPLDCLVTAASFQLFGHSTWTGRLPFVIAGLAGLVVFAFLLQDEFPKHPLQAYALALLAFSIVFLLNIRQCRYYALAMLFSLCTFWAYRRCLTKKQLQYFILLPLAGSLLFYSNYLLGTAFLLALGLVHLLFHRHELKGRDWCKVAFSLFVFSLATAPYAGYYRIWYRPDIVVQESWYVRKPLLLWWNLRELNVMGCIPWPMLILLIFFLIWLWRKDPVVRIVSRWFVLSLGYVFFLAMLSPQLTKGGDIADIRYLIPAVPFLAGIVGATLWFIHKSHKRAKFLAWAMLAALITTNLLTLGPHNTTFRWLLPAYIGEVHRPYPTSYQLACEYLEENIQKDDLVLAFPEYCNYPIMFYLGHRLKHCCLLDRNTPLGMDQVKQLDAPLLIEENFPDWFIAFGAQASAKSLLGYFSRVHRVGEQELQYRYRLVKVLDVFFFDTSRPELPLHTFGPKRDFDRRSQAVYVFRRVDAKAIGSDGYNNKSV